MRQLEPSHTVLFEFPLNYLARVESMHLLDVLSRVEVNVGLLDCLVQQSLLLCTFEVVVLEIVRSTLEL